MPKQNHLTLCFPARHAELFRNLVSNLNYTDEGNGPRYTGPYGVEIIYEEEGKTLSLGNPVVHFDLWFEKPSVAYWFALHLEDAKQGWADMEASAARKAQLDGLTQEGGPANG